MTPEFAKLQCKTLEKFSILMLTNDGEHQLYEHCAGHIEVAMSSSRQGWVRTRTGLSQLKLDFDSDSNVMSFQKAHTVEEQEDFTYRE